MRDYSEHMGEQNTNKKGTLMTIIDFRNTSDITIQFDDDTKSIKKTTYSNFTKGTVKSPYDKTIYGIACIGEGKWKVTGEKGYGTNEYSVWHSILARCYTKGKHLIQPQYIGCSVPNEWLNYQNFRDWWEDNYYQIDGEEMQLDKDLLFKGNKIYSPETCCFIPQRMNLVLINRRNYRGDTPLGVQKNVLMKYTSAYVDINQKSHSLGTHNTKEEAFEAYRNARENVFKQLANEYKDKIPLHIYKALYNRKIEITD